MELSVIAVEVNVQQDLVAWFHFDICSFLTGSPTHAVTHQSVGAFADISVHVGKPDRLACWVRQSEVLGLVVRATETPQSKQTGTLGVSVLVSTC
jgi:hypothetical protein